MHSNSKSDNQASFAIHQCGDVLIYQASGDLVLSGTSIPHGYVNATQILKAATEQTGKKKIWTKYFQTDSTQEFLAALSEKLNKPILNNADIPYGSSALNQGLQPLIIIIKGGNNQNEQGTYVHLKVALHLAQWCSPAFAVAVSDVLEAVIKGDFKALTAEAEKVQKQLQQVWKELRSETKETFWFLGDAVKAYYLENPRTEKYPGQNYSEVYDAMNQGLFGKKAKQIKAELGLTTELNRDHFGRRSLKKIEMIQRIASAQVAEGKHPVNAVKFALSIMNYEIDDYKE